jgi:hypothetical protein
VRNGRATPPLLPLTGPPGDVDRVVGMADDNVQLTDLEVIQQFSLAVRGASAPREQVIAALEADLAWLNGSPRTAAPAKAPARPAKAAVKRAPAAKRAPAKKA